MENIGVLEQKRLDFVENIRFLAKYLYPAEPIDKTVYEADTRIRGLVIEVGDVPEKNICGLLTFWAKKTVAEFSKRNVEKAFPELIGADKSVWLVVFNLIKFEKPRWEYTLEVDSPDRLLFTKDMRS